jgi:hypothetical protein
VGLTRDILGPDTNAVPLTLLFTATTTSEGAGFATAGEDFTELVDVPVVVEPGGLFPNVQSPSLTT